jgi:hypothetical protein
MSDIDRWRHQDALGWTPAPGQVDPPSVGPQPGGYHRSTDNPNIALLAAEEGFAVGTETSERLKVSGSLGQI